jgi:hypothetical protein
MDKKPAAPSCTAFRAHRQVAAGPLDEVALKLKAFAPDANTNDVLVFDDATSQQIDLDLRGTPEEVVKRIALSCGCLASFTPEIIEADAQGRPGRPKLGVVSREVTLLPRHWEWLNRQPGGASVALRKLVEEARRTSGDRETIRQSQEAAYKFMSAMAGNEEGFEEAARALFGRNQAHFDESIKSWPTDIRKHAVKLASPALLVNEAGTD